MVNPIYETLDHSIFIVTAYTISKRLLAIVLTTVPSCLSWIRVTPVMLNPEYIEMVKSRQGAYASTDDTGARIYFTNRVVMKGKVYQYTVRTVDCTSLVESHLA